jgi:hypothetical protein
MFKVGDKVTARFAGRVYTGLTVVDVDPNASWLGEKIGEVTVTDGFQTFEVWADFLELEKD